MFRFALISFSLVLVLVLTVGCGSKSTATTTTTTTTTAPHPAQPAASQPKPRPNNKAVEPPPTLSAAARLVKEGGGWYRQYVPGTGTYIQPEQFWLLRDGRYGWLQSASGDKTGPNNAGPGYNRTGRWVVENNELVLNEDRQYPGNDMTTRTTTRVIRRLPLAACATPERQPCVAIDGVQFYLDKRVTAIDTFNRMKRTPPPSGWRSPRKIVSKPGDTNGLSKSEIRAQIKTFRPEIKKCYDRQLLMTPDISGTVRATFTIMPSGAVSTPKATGVHPLVASCVAAVISTIRFPKPRGGELVNVTYPFRFSSY